MKWSRPDVRSGWVLALLLGAEFLILFAGCATRSYAGKPSIEFSVIPIAQEGGPDKQSPISGRVTGARPGARIGGKAAGLREGRKAWFLRRG